MTATYYKITKCLSINFSFFDQITNNILSNILSIAWTEQKKKQSRGSTLFRILFQQQFNK